MSTSLIDSVFELEKNHVVYDRHKYFRRGANQIELCSHGRKKASALSVNYMSVTGRVRRKYLETVPINASEPIEVDWTEISQEDLDQSISLKFFNFDSVLANSFDLNIAKKQHLKLMCFWINEGPLTRCLNRDADGVRNMMATEGKDARIVSSILVAMETKLAEHFSTHSATSLTVKEATEGLDITAGSGRVGSKTIRLANDTTIAYSLHKVKKWHKGKTEIKQMEDDWFSFG